MIHVKHVRKGRTITTPLTRLAQLTPAPRPTRPGATATTTMAKAKILPLYPRMCATYRGPVVSPLARHRAQIAPITALAKAAATTAMPVAPVGAAVIVPVGAAVRVAAVVKAAIAATTTAPVVAAVRVAIAVAATPPAVGRAAAIAARATARTMARRKVAHHAMVAAIVAPATTAARRRAAHLVTAVAIAALVVAVVAHPVVVAASGAAPVVALADDRPVVVVAAASAAAPVVRPVLGVAHVPVAVVVRPQAAHRIAANQRGVVLTIPAVTGGAIVTPRVTTMTSLEGVARLLLPPAICRATEGQWAARLLVSDHAPSSNCPL